MKRKINANSPVFLRLLDSTYDDLKEEAETGNDEVKFLLSTANFWKKKYEKDYGQPDGEVESWRKAYEEQYALDTPKYRQLLSMSYSELLDQEKNANNGIALSILATNNFWKKKYINDFNEPDHDVDDWKEEYTNRFYATVTDETIDDIFEMILNDIISIRSIVYETYNRSLSREIRQLGADLGGCRMRRSEDKTLVPESELKQAWLLDNTEERSNELQEEKLNKIFKHYNELTSEVKKSSNEYYGAMFIALTLDKPDYIFGTPHIKNEGIIYESGYEPESVKEYISELIEEKVSYIYIYIFCSPEGLSTSNWVIKSQDDVEKGFQDITYDEIRNYLGYVITRNSIFPIVTHTLPNIKHTSKCGPWLV